ncbi:MAG: N-acetyl-gamma-glutamyl-phosphate reductase [Clostridia bacterium]|nr:N-acetyl-gamma-glutamyl-phosphate reductase [Clostridia bacterium]
MKKVFIDGSVGTTGLRIKERLGAREDIELLTLPEELRKDDGARKEKLNEADIAFLCLPDAESIRAVAMIENENTAVLDTSTAHRTAPGWAYGFPELGADAFEKIQKGKRIAVPGCHASGFIALVAPLVKNGLLSADALLSCTSLTGYSGGGKKMIAQYGEEGRDALLDAPRTYGLTQTHKHLKEMKALCALDKEPVFMPIVSDFYSGMSVSVPLHRDMLNGSVSDIKELYSALYKGPIVCYAENADEEGFLSAGKLSGKDGMQIAVFGNEERFMLSARYDNLGKGASGAAVQCMNILLGVDPTTGLSL